MEKRHQVFISSTFVDLKEERAAVYQTLMEMDCIPAGMEIFPAIDDEQFNFIKRIIDDCDYYIVIIGGRYGTISATGLSYTEMEYDYATSKGLRVIGLIHGEPENLAQKKSEQDPEALEKLQKFKEKVSTGRLVRKWTSTEQLPGLVSLSLNKTIKMYPATGWVRGNTSGNSELLKELNELRKENKDLVTQKELLEKEVLQLLDDYDNEGIHVTSDLASFDEFISLRIKVYEDPAQNMYSIERIQNSWGYIFKRLYLHYQKTSEEDSMLDLVALDAVTDFGNRASFGARFDEDSKFKIEKQFELLGLITIEKGLVNIWDMTSLGEITGSRLWSTLSANSTKEESSG